MRLITVKIPEPYVDAMDELVKRGVYPNRSAIIRAAVERLLREERLFIERGLSISVEELP